MVFIIFRFRKHQFTIIFKKLGHAKDLMWKTVKKKNGEMLFGKESEKL